MRQLLKLLRVLVRFPPPPTKEAQKAAAQVQLTQLMVKYPQTIPKEKR